MIPERGTGPPDHDRSEANRSASAVSRPVNGLFLAEMTEEMTRIAGKCKLRNQEVPEPTCFWSFPVDPTSDVVKGQ